MSYKLLFVTILSIVGHVNLNARRVVVGNEASVSYSVLVLDSNQNSPLQLARVSLRRGKNLIIGKVTDQSGRAVFTDVQSGGYTLVVRLVGYDDVTDSVYIDALHNSITILLSEVKHEELTVGADLDELKITSVDLKTGNQTFEAEGYHASPNQKMVTLLQQNVLGAVKAPTGEVHIRGQHAEYSYYVDGIQIPPGVFGGFNEVVDDQVIVSASFLTGGLPAEYGGQSAAAVVLQNKVPTGHLHLNFETYAGSFLGRDNTSQNNSLLSASPLKPINMNGQAISISDHIANFGFFIAGDRAETDRRIDPPLPIIDHNHGFDYFGFAKLDYLIGENDYITSNIDWSKTITQIPFNALVDGNSDDNQQSHNSYQTLSFFHTISRATDAESDLFVGASLREGSLLFSPGSVDVHSVYFLSDSTKGFILNEDRSYTTAALYSKLNIRFSHQLLFCSGINISNSTGNGHFVATDTMGNIGQDIKTNFSGTDFGAFAQCEYHPAEWTKFDFGFRYDQQIAPNRPIERAISPRLRWNIYFDEATTMYLSYGKYFITPNIEEIRSITSLVSSNTIPTVAERDGAFEIGFLHSFDFGLRGKVDFFKKISLPGVDDQTIGATSIETEVNIASVKTTGIEAGLSYSLIGVPINAYLNTSIVHAYGSGAITGGFLPIQSAGDVTDLDHDERISLSSAINYIPQDWFFNLSFSYGSGLTNGNSDVKYGSSLFDLNQAAHTTPAWIINFSAGHTFTLSGGTTIAPSFYINNIFNHNHLLKGAFFSGASWEEPRNIVFMLTVHV
ncbi:MAG: carboxypeptidase-like regulatory domain-containing protein [bacterium]